MSGAGTRGTRTGGGGGSVVAQGMRRMLSVQVTVRPTADRFFGLTVVGTSRQRVPLAANFSTVPMFAFETIAGPVSTGATPPPLMLPLVL